MTGRPRPDTIGRLLGVLVFLAGIGVIGVVLGLAYAMFQRPGLAGGAMGPEPTLARVAASLATVLVRIGLLLVGSISGSLIANKGIRLYGSALGASEGRLGVAQSDSKADAG